MEEVGLREMRQNASDLVRRAEAGEHFTITVSGRPAATLGPSVPAGPWRTWDEVGDAFTHEVDDSWAADREQIDHSLHDPWERG